MSHKMSRTMHLTIAT